MHHAWLVLASGYPRGGSLYTHLVRDALELEWEFLLQAEVGELAADWVLVRAEVTLSDHADGNGRHQSSVVRWVLPRQVSACRLSLSGRLP